ncbi:MAG: restriction endonuclease [Rhodospirillales bacterium]|nr:restriction endonuclease [Rhodospirillales bacterium]
MLTIDKFRTDFAGYTSKWDWEIEGFIDKQNYVYPIDTDTKVISTVFERLSSPVIRSVAKSEGYKVELANQTTYPDFTLTNKENHRIAIDVKTTYLSKTMVFTLGGYNSFIRNHTKNILYNYTTYNEHWILGFIYEQNKVFDEYDLDSMPSRGDIPCPYSVRAVFIRKKHEISGLRAGSGNTKNIGSVKLRSPDEFATARGPFMRFGLPKDACDYYWSNYEQYTDRNSPSISNERELVSHQDFRRFNPQ